jgi:hypothetical protein
VFREYKVTLVDVDGSKVRNIDIAAGTSRSVNLMTLMPGEKTPDKDPTPDPIDQPADVTAEKGGIRPLTWIAFGVAAVGAGGAVYFGLQVNDAEKAYNDDPNQDDYDRFNQNKLFTNIGIGVAVVGAGVGTVLLIGDLGKKKKKPEPVGFMPEVAPIAGGAVVGGRGIF